MELLWSQFVFKIRLSSFHHLSKRRFVIDKSLNVGRNFSINSDLSQTKLSIDQGNIFRDNVHIRLGHNGELKIGEDCFFNNNCSITCFGRIVIGNHNQFGENVLFYDHNHQFGNNNDLISKQGYIIGKIVVGNNCWVGSNVTILKDVEIGDNCVIGAGCVLHKSIPANSIVINQQNLVIKPREE